MTTSPDFAFKVLHEVYPDRANNLVRNLKQMNGQFKRIDTWREQQLCHFAGILIASVADLERAYAEKQITTLAWIGRNLLEMSVWIQYCNLKPENATRFYEDAFQDAYGWAKAVHELQMYQEGEEDPALAMGIIEFEAFAATRGVALDDDFKKVAGAAKEIGNAVMFSKLNKIFSKFAHPTAWVVATAESEDTDAEFRDVLFEEGAKLAAVGILATRGGVIRVFPEIKDLVAKK